MFGDVGRGLETLYTILLGICIVSVPLALWKAVDIVIWICNNVSVSIGR